MATTKNEKAVAIPKMDIREIALTLIGDSPLIVHAWSEKAKEMMRAAQQKKAKQAKEAKDPVADFLSSLYVMSGEPEAFEIDGETIARGAVFGFPALGFKAAAVSACRDLDAKMTEVRGRVHTVEGGLVEINGEAPRMREDMVRLGGMTADLRYRGEFRTWWVVLALRYNARTISEEQIVNLFDMGGFGVGVGEWRPEKDGQNGRFHVARPGELEKLTSKMKKA